jgi:hypothetical protein
VLGRSRRLATTVTEQFGTGALAGAAIAIRADHAARCDREIHVRANSKSAPAERAT